MYTKVTHYVKPDGTYETQSVSTSDLNNIFDEKLILLKEKNMIMFQS